MPETVLTMPVTEASSVKSKVTVTMEPFTVTSQRDRGDGGVSVSLPPFRPSPRP